MLIPKSTFRLQAYDTKGYRSRLVTNRGLVKEPQIEVGRKMCLLFTRIMYCPRSDPPLPTIEAFVEITLENRLEIKKTMEKR